MRIRMEQSTCDRDDRDELNKIKSKFRFKSVRSHGDQTANLSQDDNLGVRPRSWHFSMYYY